MSRAPGLARRIIIAVQVVLILIASAVLVSLLSRKHEPVLPQQLAADLFVLEGGGGNTAVLVTPDGAMVVDTKSGKAAERLLADLRRITDRPVRFVVNTHHHPDHSHGNARFPGEATFVATAATLAHMQRDPVFKGGHGLPEDAFEEVDHRVKLGSQLIHVVRVGTGHSDGDSVVYFPQQRVVVAGDLFFNGFYPIVDHEAGGSLIDWIDTIDRVLALGPARIVPGHGTVTEPAELKAFQGYLRDLVSTVAKLRAAGRTRDQVMAEIKLPVHEARMKSLADISSGDDSHERYEQSSLAMNAGAAYDELERGGKVPEERALPGVEASEGEPEGQEADGGMEEPAAGE